MDQIAGRYCVEQFPECIFASVQTRGGEIEEGRRPRSTRFGIVGAPARDMAPIRVLVANPYLFRMVVAFAAVTLAEWAYVTGLSIDAFRKNGSIAVGFVGARLFVSALSSLFNITFIQRRSSGRMLTEIALIRAGATAGSAALAASGSSLGPLLILLAVDAVVSAQYRPVQSALIPAFARSPSELVVTATSLSTVKTLSQAIGAALGGLVLAVTSPEVVFAGAAGVFVVAAATTSPLARQVTPTELRMPLDEAARGGPDGIIRETLREIRIPAVRGILIVSGLRTFVRGMWVAVAVIASLKLLHAGSAGVGLLMLAAGIGSLIAAPISARLVTRRRIGTPAAVALISCGIPLAVIAGVPVFDLALALVAAWGIGMAVSDVAAASILYRLIETPLLPRVTGTIESTKLALEGLGAFLAPVLASTIGIRAALLIAAFPLPLIVLGGWRTLHRVDASAGERAVRLEMLHRVPCLQPLDMISLDSLSSHIKPVLVADVGVDIVRQGDPGDRFYVVAEGKAEVLIDGFVVSVATRGQCFGERALLRDTPRAATVRSLTPMRLLVLTRSDFLGAIVGTEIPRLQTVEVASAPLTDGLTRSARIKHLSRAGLLSHLDSAALGALADRSTINHWAAGETIFHQGDEGDRYFVLLDGKADVIVDRQKVNEILPGDEFGEIALLHSVPRRAGVVASIPAITLSLHRDDFLPAAKARLAMG